MEINLAQLKAKRDQLIRLRNERLAELQDARSAGKKRSEEIVASYRKLGLSQGLGRLCFEHFGRQESRKTIE